MNRFRVYGLACLFLLVAAFANATTIVMPNDEQLIAKSPAIIEGTVLSTTVIERDGRIYTETVVSVSRALKGTAPETITVRELGGELDGRITKVFGTPDFTSGERVLLFLDKTADGAYRTVDLFVGKFAAAKMVDGSPLWLRNDEVPNVLLLDKDLQEIDATNVQRDATKFEAFVEERVAGRPGLKNYGIANPVLAREESGRKIEANFTLISEPTVYRWFQFDDSRTATWYSGGTQTGYTGGGVTELQTGMSSWTSYSSAKIFYSYTGVRSGNFGGLSRSNGANEVLFDDPLDEISGTFNRSTGGVVGTGGFNGVTSGGNWTSPFFFDAAHPQGTMRAYNIVEGNLTIQNGVTPSAGVSSSRLAEIIAHEFGHTLGFGHSPDGTALMYGSVTGRGPALRTDDQVAARWLYPNGNVDPPPPQTPAAPSGVIASASGSSIIVDWTDNSNNETGFSIYLATATGSFSKAADAGANVEHATLSGLTAGTWRVYVVAVNANGSSAQSNTATVTVSGTAAPVADFIFTPSSGTGTAGVTQFTFYDQSRNASTRSWDFGDGTTSTAAVVNKIYQRTGRFAVKLTVTGSGGASDSQIQYINVTGPLTAAFSWSPANPTTNDTVTFADDSTGGVTSWRWVFGDGQSSSEQNPTKRFGSAQTYSVTLTVWRNSESSTVTHSVTVNHPAPVTPPVAANFTFTPATPVVGENITFTDTSTGSPTTWSWSFGDGRTSTAKSAGLIYNAPGTYQVTLTASNGGNSGTITKPVTVAAVAPHRSLISVATQTSGVGGTSWRTELSIFNAGAQGAYVNLLLLPAGGGSVLSRNVFLSPRQSVTYATALLDLFGVTNGAGALAIEASSAGATADLRISSRTYTNGSKGTYGQQVPDVVSLDKTLYITGMQSNAAFRTNVGLANRGTTGMPVTLTLYDASGATLGTANITVPASNFQQQPLAAYFPDIAGRSYDVLSMRVVAQAAEAVSAYASVIDNYSQDPIYVQAMPAPTSGSLTLPVVGRAPGVNGTFWRSDVALFNPTSDRMNLSIRYGGSSKTLSLPSRDTVVLDDVLSEFGQTAGQGALTVTWGAGAIGPVVTSRTYTTTETPGTYGQSIDAIDAASNAVYVPGLRNDGSYRSNAGFVNLGDTTESFFVTILSSVGTELGQTVITLGPGQQTQSSIASLFPNNVPQGNFTLAVQGDGNAKLFAYGSMVDNVSGDPVFFAGR